MTSRSQMGTGVLVMLVASWFYFFLVSPVGAQEESIRIEDNLFEPATIRVVVGTTVSWIHAGSVPHTVTAPDGPFDSGNLSPAESYEVTFNEPGSFTYYCQYHGNAEGEGMAGVVIVDGETKATDGKNAERPDGQATDNDVRLAKTGAEVSPIICVGIVLLTTGLLLVRFDSRNGFNR